MDNLLKFPATCFVDKLVPKTKFVKASDAPTSVRDLLTEEFEQIRLLYVLRPDTLNIADGIEVSEIDVFYFRTKEDYFSVNPFCALDNLIPRHTLYVVEHGDHYDLLIQHKRRTVTSGVVKWVREVSHWQKDVDLSAAPLRIEGNNLDRVYFNLISQVSGYHVQDAAALTEITELETRIAKMKRQAETLQKQVRNEKQFNRQVELNTQARSLKKEIKQLENQLALLKIK